MTPTAAAPRLALLVGAARSGTTLTSSLLDAHPAIGCPSEAGLPSLAAHLAESWTTIDEDLVGVRTDRGPLDVDHRERAGNWTRSDDAERVRDNGEHTTPRDIKLSSSARSWVESCLQTAMSHYCEAGAKAIYCDKSLDSVNYLALMREVFPHVRVVLLFRHVMDTIASGLEASPWGFQAYGYGGYVQASPGNTVAALGRYWLDHVSEALSWEEQNPTHCHRVRYEDLVKTPERVMSGIQEFLAVDIDLSVLHKAFSRDPRKGPGDYKLEFTSSVHAQSIGRGKRIPVDRLPQPLLEEINKRLQTLGYERLDGTWNVSEREVDSDKHNVWAERLDALMSGASISAGGTGVFAVVAEDYHDLRWSIDKETGLVRKGDGDVDEVLIGTAEDLTLMLTASENLGVLLRGGRLRHIIPAERHSEYDVRQEVAQLVELLVTRTGQRRNDFSSEMPQ